MTVSALALEDGSLFRGIAIGTEGQATGEVVFNTAMTGYQEILTDPSYAQQMITPTYPHIGNTGTNSEDEESEKIWATGLIIRDLPLLASSFRSTQSLGDYLRTHNVVCIADIDTRRLTRILGDKGVPHGGRIDEAETLAAARAFPGLKGMDLAKVVSTTESFQWRQGSRTLGEGFKEFGDADLPLHVVAYDFGMKQNVLRMLADRGCHLTVVPAQTSAADVLALNPSGIFLSNGPSDPEPCDYAIAAIKAFLQTDIPIFGICLGHQLLGLASGAKTLKMKFGHHGANHPVQSLDDGKVMITSQNHGFAVNEKTLPTNLRVTHKSLFDGSLQGLHRTDRPAFSFQGHTETSPGPHDAARSLY